MSIDRAATIRQAEKLLRQGKLDHAIAEYQALVADQPRDWNTANLLGDLHVRAGHLDQAIEQFSRIAENLSREGFLPKASALYKKILKIKPDADVALMKAAELAAQQGLLADARSFFTAAANGRRQRGDSKGALAVTVRLGALDLSDVSARLAAARAHVQLENIPGALHELNEIRTMLVEEGRDAEAVDALQEIVRINPGDTAATRELSRILIKQGKTAEASALLTPQAVGADTGLMLALAEMRMGEGDTGDALEVIERLLAANPTSADAVASLALSLVDTKPDLAFAVTDTIVGARIETGAWTEAADTLRQLVMRMPDHVPALTRLVDVCVDGGLTDRTFEAQGLLADAYLKTGAATEARCVAEDLIIRQPWEPAHFERLRSALAAEGHPDPARALADWLAETPAFGMDADSFLELPVSVPEAVDEDVAAVPVAAVPGEPPVEPQAEPAPVPVVAEETHVVVAETPVVAEEIPVAAAETPAAAEPTPVVGKEPPVVESRELVSAPPAAQSPHAIDLGLIFGRKASPPLASSQAPAPRAEPANVEEDLSVALDAIPPPASPSIAPPPAREQVPAADIESVFAQLRDDAAKRAPEEAADVAYARGTALFDAGDLESALEPLRVAARSPRRRFAAASLLAKIYLRQERTRQAIEWLGHAVDVPGIAGPERFDALLQMADLLEATGETASALAVCLELQADAGDFRDLAARITRLSRTQAGG